MVKDTKEEDKSDLKLWVESNYVSIIEVILNQYPKSWVDGSIKIYSNKSNVFIKSLILLT